MCTYGKVDRSKPLQNVGFCVAMFIDEKGKWCPGPESNQ